MELAQTVPFYYNKGQKITERGLKMVTELN